METSVKERLKQFIDTLNISEREFCRRIGVSSSYVMSALAFVGSGGNVVV